VFLEFRRPYFAFAAGTAGLSCNSTLAVRGFAFAWMAKIAADLRNVVLLSGLRVTER
jgi:hypothetical protein